MKLPEVAELAALAFVPPMPLSWTTCPAVAELAQSLCVKVAQQHARYHVSSHSAYSCKRPSAPQSIVLATAEKSHKSQGQHSTTPLRVLDPVGSPLAWLLCSLLIDGLRWICLWIQNVGMGLGFYLRARQRKYVFLGALLHACTTLQGAGVVAGGFERRKLEHGRNGDILGRCLGSRAVLLTMPRTRGARPRNSAKMCRSHWLNGGLGVLQQQNLFLRQVAECYLPEIWRPWRSRHARLAQKHATEAKPGKPLSCLDGRSTHVTICMTFHMPYHHMPVLKQKDRGLSSSCSSLS